MTTPPTRVSATPRGRRKADRHTALLRESARLFAERGFAGVSVEELGAAVGISGPAVYRHFSSKQALLGAILVRVSEGLLGGGREVVQRETSAPGQLEALIAFHSSFAFSDADVIRVQDRDLASLSDADHHRVRRLQREYVEVWIDVLARIHPQSPHDDLRVRANACFGLLNSTSHSLRRRDSSTDERTVTGILSQMALAALAA